ncbi:GGDEF domain-containing protein [Vibrio mimicus]|uniref:Sensor domain-containing diguanylate cyclase n=1 Tax=Vibrio mimicus TaxID=674 RepID=A0A2J9VIK7_VIBMI|nr:sensor domain-containing diguanylate cyclase [Vibrio mimicus]EEW09974.1 GGDEF family protein [Vibrio mimicus VM573]EGU19813.1 GGDEF domain-containing protein [Vibrio mimicus SX-4]KFE31449.1 diguanylate cyclase domain protein [Vibrio mimicus]PNM63626.1 sensor domain-containing diguanylate cyclase [Vibrio mimicus]
MNHPDKPENETERLAHLHKLGVLDTAAEERFDRITRLAKRLFNVPIALVSLVDENRQWFKSCFGLSVSETSRDISFCGHAILGRKVFIIEDASQDPRFADNPLVTGEPHIRFYAGVPLLYEDKMALGTLCIIDRKPRQLSQDELIDLCDLAKMAERELASVHTASLDDLTQISNRRGFMTMAKKSMAYCQLSDSPFSLAYLDLNHFKAINDDYGHQEGDIALQAFADAMRSCFRESDVFARLGGDEFAVFMSGASHPTAHKVIQRFQEDLDRYNDSANKPYRLSFCSGIVSTSDVNISLEELLSKADQVMYVQKKGRPKPPVIAFND